MGKRVWKRILAICLCMAIILGNVMVTKAASNPYPEWQTINGVTTRRCTWYAWKLTYERTGIALPGLGNGGQWYDNARNAGYSVGSTAVANCLAVWTDSDLGHVGYVDYVNSNGTMHVLEGGRTDCLGTGGIGEITISSTVGSTRSGGTQTLKGFVYLGNAPKWYSSMTPVNIGDDVYAHLIKNSTWNHLGAVDNNVQLVAAGQADGSDVWHFVRQSDGSYVIYNCKDSTKVLDVNNAASASGTNVGLCTKWGDNNGAQKWYIYGPWSGEYILKPQCSDAVLDVSNNGSAIGTNVQIWTYNNSAAQQMALYPAAKAEASTLSVTPGSSTEPTTFSWTKGKNANTYNVNIETGSPGQMHTYKEVWNLQDTFYQITLPEGYYEVCVYGCNSFSYSGSNVVKFNVQKGKEPEPVPDPEPEPDTPVGLPYVDVAEGDWFYDGAYYNYFAGTMTGTDPTHFAPYATLVRAQFATILHRIERKSDVAYTNRFPDVPDGQFYSTAVLWAAEAKVVTGYTDSGYFGTNDPITREQMVTMMYRYANYMKYESGEPTDISKFTDAGKVSEFAEDAMKWAVGNGIIEGKENEDNSWRLDPQGNTSRAECAIIIMRFLEKYKK